MTTDFELKPIGTVESPLTDPASAPKQGDEGAPEAWIVFEPAFLPALEGIGAGDEILVLTWFHLASRDVLRVHPRSDVSRPEQGVFNTRSPAPAEPDRAAPRRDRVDRAQPRPCAQAGSR